MADQGGFRGASARPSLYKASGTDGIRRRAAFPGISLRLRNAGPRLRGQRTRRGVKSNKPTAASTKGKKNMKLEPSNYSMLLSCALAGLMVAGCAQQQRRARAQPEPAVTPTAVPTPAPSPPPAPESKAVSSGD